VIALLLAAALTPKVEAQIRETLPPGPPARLEPLAQSGELLVFCLIRDGSAQIEAARIAGGKLAGDPEDVGSPARRDGCGSASLGAPFEVRRRRARQRAVVAHFADAGLSAVISLSGKVLAWTDAKAPDPGPAIYPEPGKGDTTFCAFLSRTESWTRLGWVDEAEGYAPVPGRCAPPRSMRR
jgi:hypothetical protein